MIDPHVANKQLIKGLCKSLYDFDARTVRGRLSELLADTAICRFSHPLGEVAGSELYDRIFAPLRRAFPDLERRDSICVSGSDSEGKNWVGCAGYYIGRFMTPFLGIPPTGHIAHIRFHEFFHFTDGQITEIQAVWDIPELMMQAGVWPMGASLGREWHVPGPASQDGLDQGQITPKHSSASRLHVLNMLTALQRYPSQGGVEVMELDKYWHPHFNWYGPSGIGSSRGIDGFRKWHQTPFLQAMPDRGQYPEKTDAHFFAEGAYVAVTGWPNMYQTLSGDGWLGMAPTQQKVRLRSLDFWRLEDGLIRENWVLVDILDVWRQIGVDVMARMQALASARPNLYAGQNSEVQV